MNYQTFAQETIVTPQLAAEWLKQNTMNRPLRTVVVQNYMADMVSGKWQANGETIKISADGKVLDGQHRLHAIIRAGVPIKMLVVGGLPNDSFKTIDTGMRRSAAQIVGLQGKQNATIQASIGRWLVLIAEKTGETGSRGSVTTAEILESLDRHPLSHGIATMMAEKGIRGLLPSAAGAAFVMAAEKYGQDVVENFLREFKEGQGLKKGDPSYELRERMIQNSSRVAKLTTPAIVGITIKAIRAYALNKTVGLLRWSPNEEWPSV